VTLPPVTTPVPMPIVAGPLMLHVPVPGLLLSVVVLPSQTVSVPLTGDGKAVTVTTAVVVQPVPSE